MAGNKFKLLDSYAVSPSRRREGAVGLRIGLNGGKTRGDYEGFTGRLEEEAAALLRNRMSLQDAQLEVALSRMGAEHLARIDAIFAEERPGHDTFARRKRAKKAFRQGAKVSKVASILREGKRPVESVHKAVNKLKAQRRKLGHQIAEERRALEHNKRERMR